MNSINRLISPKLLVISILLSTCINVNAQQKITPASIKDKMQWFADAKLGIFIHAGIYAVDGIDESWSFHNKKISYANYMKQLNGFTLKKYNPSAWAELIQESGAKYAVITTKHHDGVAMYDTKMNELSSVKATPAKKDMIQPFFEELRKRNIKTGAYYSLIDWSYQDYPGFIKDSSRYQVKNDYERWNRFRNFFQGQIKEISNQFNPDLWWFDGDWEHSAEEWESEKVRSMILTKNPNAIINGRLQGYGDYATPEQNFPVSRPKDNWWELCMTTNDNWGFHHDNNWKTPYEVITIFVDAVANGGNLLLDMGPMEDGTIPAEQIIVLKELGAWNKKNGEAIFNTIGGIPQGHYYGPSTLSKDSTNLYLFVHGNNSGQIMLKGLENQIKDIAVLGSSIKPSHKIVGKISWSHVPGLVYINLPEASLDKYVTVVKLTLEKPVKLYRGQGGL
ncbi:MAG TPA: alpha-L-fucosidase [Sediminibacterium sp.]|uniref:alpha-L-fucosidase n=1 Tax=Sediminibacterium sp. TaxID=1917865 RepID=UPI0008D53371|nr:alpha-L-fucosidase [Sediminibacterium sp.]OHC85270.1 MAG: alpha-L-fucosidase [Sphingobacteriia bacterium RIFOXYC2_FULL_35_18]OHC89173.1 MAG: alpha-L-fucosidase [Sphingobacteriia bacterium RIFOXYD2_FULL_35_12]HLD53551.1 alpha-L-fucosidase [Sediminibacterium sp.]